MARRVIYRDYRKGRAGQLSNRETYNRSRAQGKTCHIHREYVHTNDIDSIDDLEEFEDDDNLVDYEFHGTGDT